MTRETGSTTPGALLHAGRSGGGIHVHRRPRPRARSRRPGAGSLLLDDPQQADVDSAVTWLLPAAIGSLFGLGLLVAGVVVYMRG